MTKITSFRDIFINIGIILFFIVLSYAYMSPLLEGKELKSPDIDHHQGMSKEIADFRKETGKEPLWTSRMFSGMPAYMISTLYPGNITDFVAGISRRLFSVASFIFLYLVGFYVLLISLKVNRWLSVAGAIAFAFSSYSLIILTAGHYSKANAIAFLPLLIAGVLLAYRGKPVAGALLFAFSFSLELVANHFQITYYGFILMGIFFLIQLIQSIKEKNVQSLIKPTLYLVAGGLIAIGMNFPRLYTTWEYSKETIRHPSELTTNNVNKTSGLDKDYVVQWSYGIGETFTLLVPNFKGGATQNHPGLKSKSFEALRQNNIQNPKQAIEAVSMYHGKQPGTSGPVYMGAILIFLFVLGIFTVKGVYKWWLVAATAVSVVLSWGGNIMWLTSFLLDYLPMYNKFRAPSMTLVIAQITIPLLGIMALNDIISGRVDKNTWQKGLKWSVIITGGLSLVFLLLPGIVNDFSSQYDAAFQLPDWLTDAAIADRKAALRIDAFRSLVLISLAAGLLYAWYNKKIRLNVFIAILGVLILIDLWSVDKRYLNNDNFVSKREFQTPFSETVADKEILKDKGLNYRVLPLPTQVNQVNPFMDASTSYFHKNIGGYHAAKLRRYQDLIEHRIQPEIEQLLKGMQAGLNSDSVLAGLTTLNMLNTRYLIFDPNRAPLVNNKAFGNAWFVNEAKIVNNADEEVAALNTFNPVSTVIVDKRFENQLNNKKFVKDQAGEIKLIEFKPNYLKYNTAANSDQLAVFSEIYYSKGWNMYLDGKKSDYFRANYTLRGMVVPSGSHTVEFKFEPSSYYTGEKASYASSILLVIAALFLLFQEYRKKRKAINGQ